MLFAYQLSGFFQQASIGAANLLPLFWKENLHLGPGAIGLLNGLGSIVAIGGPLLFGTWGSHSAKPARLVAWCFLLSGLLFPLMFWLPSLGAQTILFGVTQFLRVGFLTLVPVGVLHLLGDRAGRDYGRYRRVGSLGFLIGTVATGYLAEAWGNSWILWVIAIGYLLAAIAFFGPAQIPTPKASGDSYLSVWRNSYLRNFLIATLFFSTWIAPAFTFLPLRLRELGADKGFTGWVISLCGIIAFFTLTQVGRIADRGNADSLYRWAIVGAMARALLLALPTTGWPFLFLQLLHVPTWVLGEICQIRIVRDHCPDSLFPRAQALLQISTYLGIALGSWWCGFFAGHWSLRIGLLSAAVLPLPAFYFLHRARIHR